MSGQPTVDPRIPPIQWRGVLNATTSVIDGGDVVTRFTQSPMMDRDTAASYVGLGTNQFTREVREGVIKKRGGNSHHPFHIDDLDTYLETLTD